MSTISRISSRSDLQSVALADVITAAKQCTTVTQALDAPVLSQLVIIHGAEPTITTVAALVEYGMQQFDPKRRMNPTAISFFAQKVVDRYPQESLADLYVFLCGCADGKFDGGEYYASIDVPRMMKWWTAYLEEKAVEMELVGQRQEDMAHREAVDCLAAVPQLGPAIAAVVQEHNGAPRQRSLSWRLAKLKKGLPAMHIEQMRKAWDGASSSEERQAILDEARRRNLPMKNDQKR